MREIWKQNIRAILVGIAWIWVGALIHQYIDMDGWILYPIVGTLVFLLVVYTLYVIVGYSEVFYCYGCKGYYHTSEKTVTKRGWHGKTYCKTCSDKRDKKEKK